MGFSADEQAARRSLRFLGVAASVALVGLAVTLVFRTLGDGPGDRTAGLPASLPVTADGEYQLVGPLPGAGVAGYVRNRQDALDAFEGERVAVVSLNGYATEEEARGEVGQASLLALLVAAPGGTPATVTGPLAQWADLQRKADRTERDEITKLLPTVDDPAFKSFYQSEVARLDTAIEALDPSGPIVFALVVRGSAAGLEQLAGNDRVRLVDMAPSAKAASKVEYQGLRPEETETTGQPPTRPVGEPPPTVGPS